MDNHTATTEQALRLIRKTRPKKKADLLRALQTALAADENLAEEMLAHLIKIKAISVDVAENVRYL